MKLITCISKMLMREMIILHCRVVYQSNVLPGQWTRLGMQSCSDYGFYGVVGREEGGEQNPHKLKKSLRFLPLPSFSFKNGFHFVVHLFNKTLQMLQVRKGSSRCAAVSKPFFVVGHVTLCVSC